MSSLIWLIPALFNPIFESLRGVVSKKASKNSSIVTISLFNNLIPLLFFTPLLFFIELKWNWEFVWSTLVAGGLNATAIYLFHKAVSLEDISLVAPLTSFSPLFLLVTSPLIIGEYPAQKGVAGIVLIFIGSYLLNAGKGTEGILAPIVSLVKRKGARSMLLVALIWSVSANFDKKAILASSIWQYAFFINLVITLCVAGYMFATKSFRMSEIRLEWKNLITIGLIVTGANFVHLIAITLTKVAYVVAIKRTSGLISVLLGRVVFKEGSIKQRLIAALVMFAGVLLISWSALFE